MVQVPETGSIPNTDPVQVTDDDTTLTPTQFEPGSTDSITLPIDPSDTSPRPSIVFDPTDGLEPPSEPNNLPIFLIVILVGLLIIAFVALLLSVIVGLVVRRRRQPRRKTVWQTENGYRAVSSNDSNSRTSSSVSDSSSRENRTATTNPMVQVHVEMATNSGDATGMSSGGASLQTDGSMNEEASLYTGGMEDPEPCKKTDLEQDMQVAILELCIAGHDQQTIPSLEVAPPTPEQEKLTPDFDLMGPADRLTPDSSSDLKDWLTPYSDLALSRDCLTPDSDLEMSRDRLTPDSDLKDQLTRYSDLQLSRDHLTPDLDRLTPKFDQSVPGDRHTPDFSITMSVASACGSLSDISIEKVDLGALASSAEDSGSDTSSGTVTRTCDEPNTCDPIPDPQQQ